MSESGETVRNRVWPAGTSTATEGSSIPVRGLSSAMPFSRIGSMLSCTTFASAGLVPTDSARNARSSRPTVLMLASNVGEPAIVSGPWAIG